MKMRALYAFAAIALCLTLGASFATADGASATLTTNGGFTGFVQISGAPVGLYQVYELTDNGYVVVGSGAVGSSGSSTAVVTLLPASQPTFQVRLRNPSGVTVIPVLSDPDPLWWWD
jgi:hypothetical protein